MRLVRLAISNIRSYGPEPTTVEFADGITLFWGEIGSGKSTLLAALEFGLFGLGDIKNTHLLRHRVARGEVAVTFRVGEAEYTVHRTLVRGARKGDVRQVEGYVEADGIRTDYSPTELKARVLELLGFNERPDPKAASRIYRYAVYTPQEEMKQVLLLGREERLDILRRAFGLEQYRHARRNVEEHLVRTVIAPRSELYRAEAAGLRGVEDEQEELEARVTALAADREGVEDAIGLIAVRMRRLEEEMQPYAGTRGEYERARGELAALGRVIEADAAEATELRSELARLRGAAVDPEDEARFDRLAGAHAAWERLTAERGRLRPDADRHRSSGDELGRLEGLIDRERQRLEARLEALDVRLATENPEAALTELETESARLDAEEVRLEAALAPEAQVAEEAALCHEIRGTTEARAEAAEQEAARVLGSAEELAALGTGAVCPTCQQTLTADHLHAIAAEAGATADRALHLARELRDRLVAIEAGLEGLEVRRLDLERVRRDLVNVRGRRATVEGRRGELERLRAERSALAAERTRLADRIAQGDYAPDERLRRDEVASGRGLYAEAAARYAELEAEIAAIEADGVLESYRAALLRREAAEEESRRRAYAEAALAGVEQRRAARLADAEERRRGLATFEDAIARLAGLEEEQANLAMRAAETERERVRIEVDQARIAERLAGVVVERERLLGIERRRQYLGEVQRWLTAHVVPAIAEIEEEVFERIRARFEVLFADWFARLVEADDLEARVDETFSPQLRSGEYDLDLDLASLSGGERTSLALAYRLALNTMVREEAGMGRESLLVLDEPTDGFSSGQLHRLREILGETGCDQTIIVSHEQELEGVADRVYGVTKERGVSTVAPL